MECSSIIGWEDGKQLDIEDENEEENARKEKTTGKSSKIAIQPPSKSLVNP